MNHSKIKIFPGKFIPERDSAKNYREVGVAKIFVFIFFCVSFKKIVNNIFMISQNVRNAELKLILNTTIRQQSTQS